MEQSWGESLWGSADIKFDAMNQNVICGDYYDESYNCVQCQRFKKKNKCCSKCGFCKVCLNDCIKKGLNYMSPDCFDGCENSKK